MVSPSTWTLVILYAVAGASLLTASIAGAAFSDWLDARALRRAHRRAQAHRSR